MNSRRLILSGGVFIASLFTALQLNAAVSAKALLDSAYILMGKQTALHIEVIGELKDEGKLHVIDSMWNDIEIRDMGTPVINDLGNNRRQLLQDIIIQSFDSGMYAVPPIIYIQPGETISTNSPVLKVLPVPVDTLLTVHDYADVVEVNREILDYFPDWATDYGLWIILALVVIGLAVYIYLKWLREGRIPLIPRKKPIPPFDLALSQLTKLRAENLCDRGEEKVFYTRLTDILRVYLQGRFSINALEMTTTQIMDSLKENPETKAKETLMKEILEMADFVKFAKVRPLPEDNKRVLDSAFSFVEETKPVPQPETSPAQSAAK